MFCKCIAEKAKNFSVAIAENLLVCKNSAVKPGRRLSLADRLLMKESEVILMGHPVTTNPFIIMLINMTVVFAVLIGLSFMIRLIHVVDPTKKK